MPLRLSNGRPRYWNYWAAEGDPRRVGFAVFVAQHGRQKAMLGQPQSTVARRSTGEMAGVIIGRRYRPALKTL